MNVNEKYKISARVRKANEYEDEFMRISSSEFK